MTKSEKRLATDAQALLVIAAVLAPYKDGTLPLPR